MKKKLSRWAAVLGCCAGIGMLHAQAAEPAGVSNGVLVDARGMTLYTFNKDTSSKSVCNDRCAANWPPLAADEQARASGDWSVITRDDGNKQWAYKGRPLYTWIKDTKSGDQTGEGMANNAWHVAKP